MTQLTSARRKGDLERAAVAVGRAWAASWTERLHDEGRETTGGWPGTMSEARARFSAWVRSELGERRAPSKDEIDALARMTYGSAREAWLERAGRDPEP